MRSLKYAMSTALVLTLMEVVLSSSQATGTVGSALTGVANASKYLLSSAYPLIPDRRPATTDTSSATSSTPSTTVVAATSPTGPTSTPTTTKVISV